MEARAREQREPQAPSESPAAELDDDGVALPDAISGENSGRSASPTGTEGDGTNEPPRPTIWGWTAVHEKGDDCAELAGDNMATKANFRGAVFEVLVTHFARRAGYSVCEGDDDDQQLYSYAGMPMVHGLGEGHNADVLFEPPVTLPLSPPTRLVVECKGYSKNKPVGIDVVRGAIAVRNDLNSFKRLSDEEIRARCSNRRPPVRRSPYYHVAVASLWGFAAPAQSLAAAYHVELLDYSGLPILGRIPELVDGLELKGGGAKATGADSPVRRVRAMLTRALEATEPEVQRIGRGEFGDLGLDLKGLDEIARTAAHVRAAYSATLADGTSLIMLGAQPISVLQLKATETEFEVHYNRTNRSWYLTISGVKLEFQLPEQLYQKWKQSGFSSYKAKQIKERYLESVDLVGPVIVPSSTNVHTRHIRGILDMESLRRAQSDKEASRRDELGYDGPE